MALELSGALVKKLPLQSGSGKKGEWFKQDFIMETKDQYPKKICVTVWGDQIDTLEKFAEGEEVSVSVNLESREYNERWYTEVKAWKISEGKKSESKNPTKSTSDNIPLTAYEEVPDDLPW